MLDTCVHDNTRSRPVLILILLLLKLLFIYPNISAYSGIRYMCTSAGGTAKSQLKIVYVNVKQR